MRAVLVLLMSLCGVAGVFAQEPPASGSGAVTAAQVRAAIDKLGVLDFPVRMDAARTVRRAAAAVAAPLLSEAAASHKDGYVRFRALVLLSGFNDASTKTVMTRMLSEENDRLRAVAYSYFGHHPDPAALPRLLDALAKEDSEFVRPALTRALAAYGTDAKIREVMTGLIMRGQDFFRSGVIEAIGDYKIESLNGATLSLRYLPLGELQTLDVGGAN